MKKLCILLLLLVSFVCNSQEKEYAIIKKPLVSSMLMCSNENRDKWFTIIPTFKQYNGISVKNYLTTLKLNIGKCSKRDVLVFTFVDGKYMIIRSNVELTCDDLTEVSFPLNPVQVGVLEMKSIKTIKYLNGNDGTFYVHTLKDEDRDYFKSLLIKSQLPK
jgi:hypothetical protein